MLRSKNDITQQPFRSRRPQRKWITDHEDPCGFTDFTRVGDDYDLVKDDVLHEIQTTGKI